ncbi:uncharacterized protein LOC121384798 [Gigantopelta aegis]|uniref:uncharacterized protein LOC121384798 n=1 Tax=Gigantopelta aegis TaxID=1735272 RepID=UPI001B889903|nr:uncharacterized protein LOC121384798 [Gigantopelta aegis]
MSYDYYDSLESQVKGRYDGKLAIINCHMCPYRLPAGVWKNQPMEWPELQWGDVYSFLIESPGVFTRESMKAYKSLEAHNYFLSGWVQTVLNYQPPDSIHIVLRADVRPSQRLNDEPHHPWAALSTDGAVAVAHCDCMAGLGESCSHIAALLFKVEAAVRLGYTSQTCTDLPCKWNEDFVKKIQPAEIKNIRFYKDSAVQRVQKSKRKHEEITPPTDEEKRLLLGKLYECSHQPLVLSTFSEYSDQFHWKNVVEPDPVVPPNLRTYFNADYAALSVEELGIKCVEIQNEMFLRPNVIQYIYDVTKKQASSVTWHEQRIGRITSSTVHQVLHTNINKPALSLIKTLCTGTVKELNVAPVKWGKDNEKKALDSYTQIMKSSHTDFVINEAGLLIDKKHPYLAASSDSIASCACHGQRVVEVKCPYTQREKTYHEYMNEKSCCLMMDEEASKLKETHSYYSQVQMQMYIHDTAFCDFVIFTPRFTAISYVRRNHSFIAEMLEKTRDFHVKCVMPEILTRTLENNSVPTATTSSCPDNRVYCFCNSTNDLLMIGCDEPTCQVQWYHLDCVKLKRIPKGDWFCKTCRKEHKTNK